MAGDATFVIVEGVRRAKAYLLEGVTEVEVNVFNRDAVHVETRLVPLECLRTTKNSIDISDPDKWERLDRLRRAIREGRQLSTICVIRSSVGVPLSDVVLDTLGEER